ncbi:response regulator [Brevundimonas sp.]|jgi:two-component system OmpR family response regulator|uniref:response regulator n=1 Tax=Brevundimonas sp. TaxID=1871086 RepID=UPI0037BE6209
MPLTLLHVDDEPDIREVAAIALQLDPDINLVSAPSGQDALDRLAAGMRPDVILLDVMMPSLDGPGVLARLKQAPSTSDIPVIFMTARAQSNEVDRLRALGAIGVIIKPFDPMTLSGQVRDLLAEARG